MRTLPEAAFGASRHDRFSSPFRRFATAQMKPREPSHVAHLLASKIARLENFPFLCSQSVQRGDHPRACRSEKNLHVPKRSVKGAMSLRCQSALGSLLVGQLSSIGRLSPRVSLGTQCPESSHHVSQGARSRRFAFVLRVMIFDSWGSGVFGRAPATAAGTLSTQRDSSDLSTAPRRKVIRQHCNHSPPPILVPRVRGRGRVTEHSLAGWCTKMHSTGRRSVARKLRMKCWASQCLGIGSQRTGPPSRISRTLAARSPARKGFWMKLPPSSKTPW